MRYFGPRNWNDVLALVLIAVVVVYSGWLLKQEAIEKEIVMFILGILFAKFSDVVQFYFRRAPDAKTGEIVK